MTIDQLLKMPVGEKTGGFILTVKKTKKAVKLPSGQYIHTVILVDDTGEMLADFKDQGGKGAYNPLVKGQEVRIVVSEIQHADPTSKEIALRSAKKLYVDQFTIATSTVAEFEAGEEYPDWRTTVRGKIRHGLVCSFIQAGKEIDKVEIKALEDYIMNGE